MSSNFRFNAFCLSFFTSFPFPNDNGALLLHPNAIPNKTENVISGVSGPRELFSKIFAHFTIVKAAKAAPFYGIFTVRKAETKIAPINEVSRKYDLPIHSQAV